VCQAGIEYLEATEAILVHALTEMHVWAQSAGDAAATELERVMNSIRNGLGMGKTEIAKEPSRPCNPHFYAVFAQVHNTL
jgi:hypothetical protein